jgi:hypothetical protein
MSNILLVSEWWIEWYYPSYFATIFSSLIWHMMWAQGIHTVAHIRLAKKWLMQEPSAQVSFIWHLCYVAWKDSFLPSKNEPLLQCEQWRLLHFGRQGCQHKCSLAWLLKEMSQRCQVSFFSDANKYSSFFFFGDRVHLTKQQWRKYHRSFCSNSKDRQRVNHQKQLMKTHHSKVLHSFLIKLINKYIYIHLSILSEIREKNTKQIW